MAFIYDVIGPAAVIYNGTTYYYTRNAQGDVTGIVNASGTQVAEYYYDAWGNPLTIDGAVTSTVGNLNPLRYRGYVYDTETGLYYLQSRYYNPVWGRFISPDTTDVLAASPNNATWDKNLYAYCDNNPVNRKDDGGQFWNFVFGAAAGALVGVINAITEINGPIFSGENIAKIAISATCGAIGGIAAASGIGWVTSAVLGGVTGSIESIGYQLVENRGDINKLNYSRVATSFASGFISGAIGGDGATLGNKYMQRQTTRFLNHIASDGLETAGKYFYKMTAKYSKQFIGKTALGVARSGVASLLL